MEPLSRPRQLFLYLAPFPALAFFTIWASFEATAFNLTLVSLSLFIYCLAILALSRRWDKPTCLDWVIAAYFAVVFLSLIIRPSAAGPSAPTAGSNSINPVFPIQKPKPHPGIYRGIFLPRERSKP